MSNEPKSIEILATQHMQGIAKNVYSALSSQHPEYSYQESQLVRFANGEIKSKIPETIRQKDVYLFHGMQQPDPNTSLVELLLNIDTISRASAKSLTLVLPYMSYSRQDRKDEPRVPISAKMVANVIEVSGLVNRIMTMDFHSDQLQGFYNIPVDNLPGYLVHREYFIEKYQGDYSNLVVVAPDRGGIVRAGRFASSISPDIPAYLFNKRRMKGVANKVESMQFVGEKEDIVGKDVILYDDMIDTGGTLLKAAEELRKMGARHIYACATHGLFSNINGVSVEEKFRKSGIEVVITNSIPRSADYYEANKDWLRCVPIEKLLASAVYESSQPGGSVSKLFAQE